MRVSRRLLFLAPFALAAAPLFWLAMPAAPVFTPLGPGAYLYLGNVEAATARGYRVGQQPALPMLLAVGDSHTYGRGVRAEEAWPAVLAEMTGLPVANLGRNGAEAGDIPALLAGWRAAVVVYGVCGNDVLPADDRVAEAPLQRGMTYAELNAYWYARRHGEWIADLRAARTAARDAAPVAYAMVVGTPEDSPGWIASLESDLAAAGWLVIPATYLDAHSGESWRVHPLDGHPNEDGHRAYAEHVALALGDAWLID